MAVAKPVVATDVGGVSEMVRHDVTGLLVPPGDLDEFVESLARLIDDRTLAREMGEAGRRRIMQEIRPANLAPMILNLYRDILRQHTESTNRKPCAPPETSTRFL